MFATVRDNGFVEEQEIKQLYSTGLDKFLADRYVVGTCPKCGYSVRSPSNVALPGFTSLRSF